MRQKRAKALKKAVAKYVVAYEQENPGKLQKGYKMVSKKGEELWKVNINHVHRLVRKHVRDLRVRNMVGKPISENNKARYISLAMIKANRFSIVKQKLGFSILGSHITEPK